MNIKDIQISLEENGLIPDKPDYRDYPAGIAATSDPLPSMIDLREKQSPIKNQGKRGTCVAFSAVAVLEKIYPGMDLSEQFVYDWCKKLDGYDGYGTYMRVGAKVITDYGACLEAIMPYEPNSPEDITKTQEPTEHANENAKQYRTRSYAFVQNNPEAIKQAIRDTEEVYGGFLLYGNYGESLTNGGWFTIPEDRSKQYGHAMEFAGYDDDMVNPITGEKGAFFLKNSWGDTGDNGYYYVSYSYIGYPHQFSNWSFIELTNTTMEQPFKDEILKDMPWAWEALQYFKDNGDLVGLQDGTLGFSEEAIRLKVSEYKFYKRKGLL